MTDAKPLLQQKRRLHHALRQLAEAPPHAVKNILAEFAAENAEWRVSHPVNHNSGLAAVADNAWIPLRNALPDMERRDLIFVGGEYRNQTLIAALGHYCGTFQNDWLGIRASRKLVYLRYGEVYELDAAGRVARASCLWDILDLVRQCGRWPLGPARASETPWPAPLSGDGLVFRESDAAESRASLARVLAMHDQLGAHDDLDGSGRAGLLEMGRRCTWHPRFMWHGPAGIGTTRGLEGFVDGHQLPWRLAFPNRKGGAQWDALPEERERYGGGHYIRIGDGHYAVTGGWPSVIARHLGDGFMGLPASGAEVTFRVMDFYMMDGDLIRQNWVPIDFLDFLRQVAPEKLDEIFN
ncbi:MAG: ester cyclase [Alphaproteobacteria bacterium]|nr:ester cyclase [Alphaproteobacteria bacterium]MDA8010620.1 ester cyclase [Alphaproteobacteria bacterium]